MSHQITSEAMNKKEKKAALQQKNYSNYESSIELEKFIRELPTEALIMSLKSKINPCNLNSYIKAKVLVPVINEDLELEDYRVYNFKKRWNKKGQLIVSELICRN
jgi:hypothetical protein